MTDFRQLSDEFWVSPQITLDDLEAARGQGFRVVVNNRPEGESPDQVPGSAIADAARAAGMGYVAIPVTHAGFTQEMVAQLAEVLEAKNGPILAYCRSGTRSTLLWALTRSALGDAPDDLSRRAAAAGYDLSPIAPALARPNAG